VSEPRGSLQRVPGRAFDAAAVHRAILSGLASSIGRLDEKGEYVAPRGVRFAIFPGSALHRSEAPWVMAAELVETTRLYARTCAKIRGDWVERVAPHLVRREHFEPHWRRGIGQVAAWERVSINGLVLVPRRRVPYGPIDPKAAREIFIQSALVDEQIDTDGAFLDHNRELIERLEVEETKRRQRGVSMDIVARYEFYDARIPADVHSTPSFESWRRDAERGRPRLLFMSESDLRRSEATGAPASDFPDMLDLGGLRLPLEYRHEPGDPDDGVTMTVPIAALPQVSEDRTQWLVPGLARELIAGLIRSLPKRLRVRFVPAAEYAEGAHEAMVFGEGSLPDRLARHLHRLTGTPIVATDFRPETLPTHLRMHIRVIDHDGAEIAKGRDLTALKRDLAGRARASLASTGRGAPATSAASEARGDLARPDADGGSDRGPGLVAAQSVQEGLRDFPVDGLPERTEVEQGGMRVTAYPALVDEGETVAVRLMPTAAGAQRVTRDGLRRLLVHAVDGEIRPMLEFLPGADGTPLVDKLALLHAPLGPRAELENALTLRIAELAFLEDRGGEDRSGTARNSTIPRTPAAFAELLAAGRPRLWQAGLTVSTLAERILTLRQEIMRVLEAPLPSTWESCTTDVRAQLTRLLPPAFMLTTAWEWLVHVPRYLAAILQRFESIRGGGHARDMESTAELRQWQARLEAMERKHFGGVVESRGVADSSDFTRLGAALVRHRWMLEEYRVSLFAQRLRTAIPVSAERLERHWRESVDAH